jgi:hypothetical protein
MSVPYNNIYSRDLCSYIWLYNTFSELSYVYDVIPTKDPIKSYRHEKKQNNI